MNFWKRLRWICSGLLVVTWLIAVTVGASQELDKPTVKPLDCTTNCL